ncbi:MAG: hypothetical protein WDM81_21785 [Rhizomicrobium sp.]
MAPKPIIALTRRPSRAERCASVASASTPPSPLLSARMMRTTYFSVTMMTSAQRMSDSAPKIASSAGIAPNLGGGEDGFAHRVERAGADVAEDDAERAQRQHRVALERARPLGGRRRVHGGHVDAGERIVRRNRGEAFWLAHEVGLGLIR